MDSKNTVAAIYEMREAAERKARAEILVSLSQTSESKGALLDATLELEEKTQDAIEHCTSNECTDATHGHGAAIIDLDAHRKFAAD